jgi:hypothetical protein
MSDESSDNEQTWWMPAGRPEPAEPEESAGLTGRIRPIGPLGLRSVSRRPYVLTGVAVAALLGGAGAALAATNSPAPGVSPSAVAASPAPSPTPAGRPGAGHGPQSRRFGGFGGFGGFGLGGGAFGALHGQFVVPKSSGGYQTLDVQSGQVTAVSATSITLKSRDGYTKAYVVASSTAVDAQRDGIGSVKVGNQVSVVATVSGSTATATTVADMTLLQQNRSHFGFGRPRSVPSPAPSAQTG